MIWRDFNPNDRVRVKLTEEGLAEYKRQADELNSFLLMRGGKGGFSTEPKLDEDGYYRLSMHELMSRFGHMVSLGMTFPFEVPIQIGFKE